MTTVVTTAPGRVNLIGDHTDTTGGWCLPMAVDLATTVRAERCGDVVELRSSAEPDSASVTLGVTDPASIEPLWARYVAGVVAEARPAIGLRGTVDSTVPPGAGLSSSAALEVAVALALGAAASPLQLALLCQRAEQRSSGVPCGVMDQLASAAGVAGHALLIDCTTLTADPVPIPGDVEVVAVHSGEPRRLAGSAYAERRAQVEAASTLIGPLRDATPAAVEAIDDPLLRRRARHVVGENARVHAFAAALRAGDAAAAGALMIDSHASLRDDFAVSTPALDALVERLVATPGVLGARLTGAGFGGCAVALCRPGALQPGAGLWHLRPSAGARVEESS
ncbi:MAG: galactokinase family protein [Ilumatobacteraceae bacterium]